MGFFTYAGAGESPFGQVGGKLMQSVSGAIKFTTHWNSAIYGRRSKMQQVPFIAVAIVHSSKRRFPWKQFLNS